MACFDWAWTKGVAADVGCICTTADEGEKMRELLEDDDEDEEDDEDADAVVVDEDDDVSTVFLAAVPFDAALTGVWGDDCSFVMVVLAWD